MSKAVILVCGIAGFGACTIGGGELDGRDPVFSNAASTNDVGDASTGANSTGGTSPGTGHNGANPTTPTNTTNTNNNTGGAKTKECSGLFQVEEIGGAFPDNRELGADYIYNTDLFHSFRLEVKQSDWDWLNEHAVEETYVPANFVFEGRRYLNVGVRYKGGYTTLPACFDEQGQRTCSKLSLKLNFKKYDDCGRFFGLRKLILNSSIQDKSLMRERISYGLMRKVGVPAGQVNHAQVFVNDQPLGVFTNVEAVDKEYLEERFQDEDGNLYKEVWPIHTEAAPYQSALRTNEKDGNVSRMIAFAQVLERTTLATFNQDVASFVDPVAMTKILAVSSVIGHLDGPPRFYCWSEKCENHNYYWYDEPGGLVTLLAWDLDSTLWGVEANVGLDWWSRTAEACVPTPSCEAEQRDESTCSEGANAILVLPPQCDKLNTFSILNHSDVYLETLQSLLTYLQEALQDLFVYQNQIREAVRNDAHGPGIEDFQSYNDWLEHVLTEQRRTVDQKLSRSL